MTSESGWKSGAAGPSAGGPSWRLLDRFALRSAGFPLAWLETLASPELCALADTAYMFEAELRSARAATLDAIEAAPAPQRVKGARRRWLSLARRIAAGEATAGCAVPEGDVYDEARGRLDALARLEEATDLANARLAEAYAKHLDDARRSLAVRFATAPDLRLALLMANESGFARLDDWLTSDPDAGAHRSHDVRNLDTLIMYLERFCAKNETNAHFGPVAVGRIDPDAAGLLWDEDRGLLRELFFTHWAAEALAERICADPTLATCGRPRRSPTLFLEGQTARVLTFRFEPHWEFELGKAFPLGDADITLVEACDGEQTLGKVAPDVARRERVVRLSELGCLTWPIEIPVGTVRPLDDLAAGLPDDAGKWSGVIAELRADLTRLAEPDVDLRHRIVASMKSRFHDATGRQPERGHGRIYADRAILYEECREDLAGLRLGGSLLAALTDEVGPFLDLLLLPARRRFGLEQDVLAAWFREQFGAGRRVSLADYLATFEAARQGLQPLLDDVDAHLHDLLLSLNAALLAGHDGSWRHEVDPRLVADIHARAASERPEDCRIGALANPDVMIAADSLAGIEAGEFSLVIGDCHAGRELLSHSCFSYMLADASPGFAAHLMTEYEAIVDPDEVLVDIVRWHWDKTHVQLPLPCPDLELQGRSPKARENVLSLDDLYVLEHDGRVRLGSDRLGSFVRLTAPPLAGNSIANDPFVPFSFPRFFSGAAAINFVEHDHLPRVTSGRMVLSRERWRVPVRELIDPAGGWQASNERLLSSARALMAKLGLPRYVFVRLPAERKPLFVDFDSPLSVRQLTRHARRGDGTLEFSEMLPGPAALWLLRSGGPVSAELRLTYFLRPGQDRP